VATGTIKVNKYNQNTANEIWLLPPQNVKAKKENKYEASFGQETRPRAL